MDESKTSELGALVVWCYGKSSLSGSLFGKKKDVDNKDTYGLPLALAVAKILEM